MPDTPNETIRLLEAELAHMRSLSASLKKQKVDVPIEVEPAVKALKARIAHLRRAPVGP